MFSFWRKKQEVSEKSATREHFESLLIGTKVLLHGAINGIVVYNNAEWWDSEGDFDPDLEVVVAYLDTMGAHRKDSFTPGEAYLLLSPIAE